MPPPWLEFTTSEPSLSATRVRPPGTMRIPSAPESTKGRRSTWRGATPEATKVGQVDSAKRRLGDEAFRRVAELAGELLDLALRRVRADQHAVAAGAVDLLHHELVKVVEHVGQSPSFSRQRQVGTFLRIGSSPVKKRMISGM